MSPNTDTIQLLLDKCKHPDTEVKSDAIGKLQLAFESTTEIADPDTIIGTFKPLLRSANPHLSLSVLFALPSLIRLLHTEHAVRHALIAFMAPGAGGLLERMGDNRERTREGAREGVQELSARCLALGLGAMKGKSAAGARGDPESVGALFERYLKEGGFGSKVARVREQCLVLLTSIRRAHTNFPLRPYLTPLIDALQDSDGSVRTLAQQTVVMLFGPGSGVSDGARTELKKEAAKKQVRKQIWDPLWERVCGVVPVTAEYMVPLPDGDEGLTSSQTSESGVRTLHRSQSHGALAAASAAGSSRPASRMAEVPGEADISPVHVASARDLENEFAAMLPAFQGRETEHNWLQRENAIQRVRGMLKADIWRRLPDAFLAGLKGGFIEGTLKALTSLRTTLSAATCALYMALATTLHHAFDPSLDTVFRPLLRMSSLTKKIAAQLSQSTLTTIIEHTSPHARLVLPDLFDSVGEKNVQTRTYALSHLRTWLLVHGRSPVEHFAGSLDGLDKALRRGLADPNPMVREEGRKLFWAFEPLWPDRARPIMESLDANARRGLERANPKLIAPPVGAVSAAAAPPGTRTAPSTPATSASRKSGIAATIAAHRERMKKAGAAGLGVAPGAAPPMPRAVTSPTSVTSSSAIRTASASATVPLSASSTASFSPSPPPSKIARPPSRVLHSPDRPSHIPLPASHARSPSTPSTPSPTKPRVASVHARASSDNATPATRVRSPVQRSPLNHTTSTPAAARREAPRGASRLSSPPVVGDLEDLTNDTLDMPEETDETLLMAQNMPLPREGDDDDTFQPFNFSPAPRTRTPPPATRPTAAQSRIPISPTRKSTRRSSLSSTTSNPLFSPPIHPVSGIEQQHVPQSVIEDALRAQAEQAESAADRLLELVEPDDDLTQTLYAPRTGLAAPSISHVVPRGGAGAGNSVSSALPVTPLPPRVKAVMRGAELFQDSPAHGSAPSMVGVLAERKHEGGMWQRRVAPLNGQRSKFQMEPSEQADKLSLATTSLSSGIATTRTIQDAARVCADNACETTSPVLLPPNGAPTTPLPEIWSGGKTFDALFDALMKFLIPERNGDVLEFGLVLLWEMLENQRPFLDGRQMEMFTALLNVRWCNLQNVIQATNAVRDAITTRFDPVFGVTQLNACLRAFLQQPIPPMADEGVRSATYAFGLVGLGKFIMRLPAEILEDELPRLKGLLLSALTDKSSDVREAANIAVVAAQLVLQDETHLFVLLDGLDNGKKNLLTYYFERYKTRSAADTVGQTHRRQGSGQDLIEKEMKRLDLKATPPRSSAIRSQ